MQVKLVCAKRAAIVPSTDHDHTFTCHSLGGAGNTLPHQIRADSIDHDLVSQLGFLVQL